MNSNKNNIENFNELVFENRNKEYGAYALRASYNENMNRSLLITCAFFGLLTLLGVVLSNTNVELPDIITDSQAVEYFKTTEVVIQPKEKLKEIIKPKEEPKSDNGQFKPEDDKVKGNDKTTDDLNMAKNANPFGKTDSVEHKDTPPPFDPPPTKLPPPVVMVPDKMPEFPEMGRYMRDNLHFPQAAIENLEANKCTVYLTFVVELDGSITDVKILKGIGYGCEQEAVKVVKNMPSNWIPGMSKGKPCRAQCNLPIKFTVK